jgi:hypothetical protein
MRELRNNVTHNHLPGNIGSSVRRVSKDEVAYGFGTYTTSDEITDGVTFGVGDYTPSGQIKEIVTSSLDILVKALEAIREQIAIDKES